MAMICPYRNQEYINGIARAIHVLLERHEWALARVIWEDLTGASSDGKLPCYYSFLPSIPDPERKTIEQAIGLNWKKFE